MVEPKGTSTQANKVTNIIQYQENADFTLNSTNSGFMHKLNAN